MRRYTISVDDTSYVIDVEEHSPHQFQVQLDGRTINVRLEDQSEPATGRVTPSVQVGSGESAAPAAPPAAAPTLPQSATPKPAPAPAASRAPATGAPAPGGASTMTAPMPGVILSVTATVGAQVSRGDTVLILEAMKMKNALKAPRDGVVAEILVDAGQQVTYGQALARLAD